MKRLISGAQVFTAGELQQADIVIEGDLVSAIVAPGTQVGDADVVVAAGLVAIPGGVDVHVHTREPGYTHKEDIRTCTEAAAAGGYTTIFGMPNLDPPTMRVGDLEHVFELYETKSLVDYNHNPAAKLLDEIAPMADMGIRAYKIYMVVDTGRTYPHPAAIGVHDHGELYQAMQAVAETGLRLMVHPHDQAVMDVVEQSYWKADDRSPQAYARTLAVDDGLIWDIATATLLRLAEATGCKLHIVHAQTTRQIEMIAAARAKGVDVSAETNHWTIFLGSWEQVETMGSYVLSYWVPDHHKAAVWDALRDGTIDMLSSDHAPHTREEKDIGWEDAWAAHTGTPGIQYQLPLMIDAYHAGKLSFDRVVDLCCTAPAERFGLDKKGSIEAGKDADIVLLDLDKEWTITNDSVLSKIGWTPYDGRSVKGAVVRTLVRGKDVFLNDEIVAAPGHGKLAGGVS